MCTPQCMCENLGGRAFDEAIKAWKYVRHYTENLQKLQVKLRDLDDCMEIITREVSVANGRGDEIKVNVQHWQTDAVILKDNIEQLIGEGITKASISCIACSCPNIVWRYKFSKQAEVKMADADALIGRYYNFNHQISHPSSHYMENLQKLKEKWRDLSDCREIIRRKVSEANDRGDEIEVNVSHWQTDAESLLVYIEQLIRESTNICSTACPCPDITWQHNFSKQAEEKIAKAVELITNCNNFNQIAHPRPRQPESLSDKNYVNFDSRVSILKDIMDALKDSNVNMIGVFGLGGVGKTTLVKEVGEQMRKDGTFKQVAMAVVSKDLNVEEVQSKLADSLNFEFKAEANDQKRRAMELWNKFTNGDKYLIILDDIWKEVKMEAIGIPCTNEKKDCKVVLTSRKEDLLRITMKADRNFRIGELSEAEAMDLFKKKVGKTIESQPEIDSLAQEVCRKCKGLPVAINAIGAALEDKSYRTWKNALVKLERHMVTQIEGVDPSVWASLYVSYDMLRSPDAQSHSRSSDAQSRSDAQSCFLLCCLFHEDAEIPIDELTRLCIARSLLAQNPFTLDEARNAVHTVVDALKSASLLTTGSHENVVRIHDVIRDVGISIAGDQGEAFLIDHGAPQWPPIRTNAPSYSAISLAFKDIKRLPSGLVYPQLHTLIVENSKLSDVEFPHTLIVENSKLSDVEFPDNFFNGMTQLSVLEITTMRMRRLPSSLAKLAKLRMLYLDGCELADIAVLKHLKSNLEVLGIRRSSIEALPPEIGQLTSLRVLDLEDCDKLRVIPRGAICTLTGLEELYFPFEFEEWKATIDEQQDTSNRDNVSLEDLRRLLNDGQLTTLHIHIPDVKLLPNDDQIFANLKGFKISVGSKFYSSEGKLSTTRTCMLKAKGIQLRNELISLVDRLSNKLTVLIIEHFKLKYLFTPTTAKELVHLKVLKVTSCEIMEGIVGFEGQKDENEITGEVKFSKLKRLKLKSLPNLISFFAKKEEMGTTMGSFSTRAQPLFNEQVIFPVLKRLTIAGLGSIIKIWDKQLVVVWQEQGSFCQLTNLKVRDCSKLMHVFPSNMHPLLKNLEKLYVWECETMKRIAEFEGERDEDGVRNEVGSPTREHLRMVGVTEIQDEQPLPKPKKEGESSCRPVNNDDIIVFPRLEGVTLRRLPKLKSFYTETQGFFCQKVIFPVLERLTIDGLDNIIKIWDKKLVAVWQEQGSFCQLTYVNINKCEKLMHMFPSNMHPLLKNLKELEVEECETMKGIAEFEGERDEDGVRNEVGSPAREHLEMVGVTKIQDKQPLPKPKKEVESLCRPMNNDDVIVFPRLEELKLRRLPKLKSFYTETQGFFSHKVIFPVLGRLNIDGLGNIIKIWDKQLVAVWQEQGSFCQLTDLEVSHCSKLMHVFPSNMHPLLKNLEKLEVDECETMKGIAEFEGERDEDGVRNEIVSPAREHLEMVGVTEIEDKQPLPESRKEVESLCRPLNNDDIIVFPRLKTVTLWRLLKLKSFYSETQGIFSHKVAFPVLERVSFWSLDKITRIWDNQPLSELEKKAKSFCQLMKIDVSDCNQLEYVLPSYMLPLLENLEELDIQGCRKMEVIISNNPLEKEAANNNDAIRFPQLKTLELKDLPNLKSFICSDETQLLFSNKVAFPVLERLYFWSLDKITRIWDNQPLSELEKKAKSFCQLMKIAVSHCNQLEYVLPSYMLPLLENLEGLDIHRCRKMEVIISNNPLEKEAANNNDALRFPQLKTLEVKDLPNLKSFICSAETQLLFSNKVAFPVLERVSFWSLDKITRIWDNQPLSELEKKAKSFCQLMKIDVSDCNQLEYVLPSYMLPLLENLEELDIQGCRKMEVIISNNPLEKEAANNNDAIRFPQLKTMELKDLPNLKSFICSDETQLFSNKDAFPVLEDIDLDEDSEILRDGTYKKEVSTEECSISGKENDHNGEQLDEDLETPTKENLKVLRVSDCPTMEGIVEFEAEIYEDGLRNEVKVGTTEGNSNIHALPLFNGKVGFPILETLKFSNLSKITRIWDEQPLSEQEKEAKSFCKLMVIDVNHCHQLEYVLPSYMLPQLKNILQRLLIWNCKRMEVIISNNPEEKEATNNNGTIRFPQLREVFLASLPNFKTFLYSETQLFFSNKDVFPVLEYILLLPYGTLEFLRNETSTKEVSIEECSTSGKESGHNGEEFDEDLCKSVLHFMMIYGGGFHV